MGTSVIPSVQTEGVGFAPILQYYYEKCAIAQIIDNNVPLDSRRKVLTHGQASIAIITSILFQVLQLYRVCRFAEETTVLDVILPDIDSKEYFDDRLADTLDALYTYGLGNIETLVTQRMITEYEIENNICHNDTTSVSVYGDCNNNKTPDGIKITFGYSKRHRQDLKQFIWSLSVSSDSAFPLFQKAYSGNTADVDTYVEQWQNLIDLLGVRDFLYVADSKIITKENIAHINDNEGFFVGPAPMYESYKEAFYNALDNHNQEGLIDYKNKFNRGFEVPFTFCHQDKTYHLRMIVLYDHGLFNRRRKTIVNRVERTRAGFESLNLRLNKYHLKTREAIDKACGDILKKYYSQDFFEYSIENNPHITYKNKKRGRPSKDTEKDEALTDQFNVTFKVKTDALKEALYRCGYYPLITNKPDLTIEDAMMAHKHQYKSEHTYRRSKCKYRLEPIYLHTPERIEALLLLFKIALQIIVLIERTARKNIHQRNRGLDNFMPNRKDVRNPKTEYLLAKFEHVVKGEMVLPDGNRYGFVSELTPLQRDILSILEVPAQCFNYGYLFDTS